MILLFVKTYKVIHRHIFWITLKIHIINGSIFLFSLIFQASDIFMKSIFVVEIFTIINNTIPSYIKYNLKNLILVILLLKYEKNNYFK